MFIELYNIYNFFLLIDMVLSPRTVIAFIRYFSRDVVGKLYKIPVLSELEDALFTLTEQLVFRLVLLSLLKLFVSLSHHLFAVALEVLYIDTKRTVNWRFVIQNGGGSVQDVD